MSPIVAQYFGFFGLFGIHWGFLVILGTCLWFLWFVWYFHCFFGYFVDGPWHFVYSQCFFVILSMSHGLICFPKIGFVIWHWRLESWICMFFAMIENTTAANVTLAYIYIYIYIIQLKAARGQSPPPPVLYPCDVWPRWHPRAGVGEEGGGMQSSTSWFLVDT